MVRVKVARTKEGRKMNPTLMQAVATEVIADRLRKAEARRRSRAARAARRHAAPVGHVQVPMSAEVAEHAARSETQVLSGSRR